LAAFASLVLAVPQLLPHAPAALASAFSPWAAQLPHPAWATDAGTSASDPVSARTNNKDPNLISFRIIRIPPEAFPIITRHCRSEFLIFWKFWKYGGFSTKRHSGN
jgi:hypothetical protein